MTDNEKWLIQNKVMVHDPVYDWIICSEMVSVTRCSIQGNSHQGDHPCARTVNDDAIDLCAKKKHITRYEAITLMRRGSESLQKWRQEIAKAHGWVLVPSKSFEAAQMAFK